MLLLGVKRLKQQQTENDCFRSVVVEEIPEIIRAIQE
jgi:hypothetical protein